MEVSLPLSFLRSFSLPKSIMDPDHEERRLTPTRKKYRKMRIVFDEKMHQNNETFLKEQMGIATLRRLMQENEFDPPPPVAKELC